MIKPGALIIAAAMAAVSAGTYFGLGLLPPGVIPPPLGRLPPPPPRSLVAPPVAETSASSLTPAAAASTSGAAPVTASAAPAGATPTEQELAEEPAPKPVQQVAQAAPAPEPAATAKPEPKPEPKKTEPKAAPAPEAQSEPKEAAAAPVAKHKPAPKAAAAPAEEKTTEAAGPASDKPAAPTAPDTTAESDAMKQWWPEPSKLPPNQLKLMYAGDVQGEAAIGLLFASVPNMDSLKLHGHVRDAGGYDVAGTWEPGKNPQLVVYRGLKAGRYTVILDKELADVKGFALGQTLQGAVYITAK